MYWGQAGKYALVVAAAVGTTVAYYKSSNFFGEDPLWEQTTLKDCLGVDMKKPIDGLNPDTRVICANNTAHIVTVRPGGGIIGLDTLVLKAHKEPLFKK